MQTAPPFPPRALTIPGVCAALSIRKTLAYALIKAGELDKFKIGGRTLVTVESVEALIERARLSSTASPAERPQRLGAR